LIGEESGEKSNFRVNSFTVDQDGNISQKQK
jgi:hypothetical protein